MFSFKKKNQPSEPKKETAHEQVCRSFDETGSRLGESVRKMEERLTQRVRPRQLRLVK